VEAVSFRLLIISLATAASQNDSTNAVIPSSGRE
jgi:hypothetical protein